MAATIEMHHGPIAAGSHLVDGGVQHRVDQPGIGVLFVPEKMDKDKGVFADGRSG